MHISLDQQALPDALLKVKVEQADYQQEVQKQLKEYSKKAQLKGFRPGKVPMMHIKQLYGSSVIAETVHRLALEALGKYAQEKKWNLMGEPLLEPRDIEHINWQADDIFELSYRVGLVEDFEWKTLSSLELTKYEIQPDDRDVETAITGVQQRFGDRIHPDTVGHEDDILYGTFSSKDAEHKKEKKAFIHFRNLLAEVKKQFQSQKEGYACDLHLDTLYTEKQEITALKKYLQKDGFETDKALSFLLTQIERTEKAPINQTLFDKVYGEGRVKDEKDFRNMVEMSLKANYLQQAQRYFQQQLQALLQAHVNISLPGAYLQAQFKTHVKGQVDEKAYAQAYEHYVADIPWRLIKQRIVKEQNITLSPEQLQEEAKKSIYAQFNLTDTAQGPRKEHADTVLTDFLQDATKLQEFYQQLEEDRIYAWLMSQLSTKTEQVSITTFHDRIQQHTPA